MKKLISFSLPLLLFGGVLTLSACKSVADVPKLKQVKRLAVISAHIDHSLKNIRRPARLATEVPRSEKESLQLTTSMESNSVVDKSLSIKASEKYFRMNQILENSVLKIIESYSKFSDWQVLEFGQYINTSAFHKLIEFQEEKSRLKRQELADNQWQNVLFLRHVLHPHLENFELYKNELSKFMSLLRLDGLIFIDIDCGYKPNFAVRGAGTAQLIVDFNLNILGKDGQWLLQSYKSDVHKRGVTSVESLPMLADTINFDQDTQAKIEEVISVAINEQIQKMYALLTTSK